MFKIGQVGSSQFKIGDAGLIGLKSKAEDNVGDIKGPLLLSTYEDNKKCLNSVEIYNLYDI